MILRMVATKTDKSANAAINTEQGERHPWAGFDSRWQAELREEASQASSQHPLNGPRTTGRCQTTTMYCQQVRHCV